MAAASQPDKGKTEVGSEDPAPVSAPARPTTCRDSGDMGIPTLDAAQARHTDALHVPTCQRAYLLDATMSCLSAIRSDQISCSLIVGHEASARISHKVDVIFNK